MDTPNTNAVDSSTKKESLQTTISNIMKVANTEHGMTEAQNAIDRMNKDKTRLCSHMNGNTDFIEERLKQFETVEALTKAIQTKEQVDEFFTDDDGNMLSLIPQGNQTISEAEDLEFKKGLLVYLKQMELSQNELDEACEEFARESRALTEEIGYTVRDFVATYMEQIKELRKTIEDTDANKAMISELDHIESGFHFGELMKTFDKHPTIPANTISDMHKDDMIVSLGSRYRTALKRSGVVASLITFISNTDATSFEEIYLPPDKYRKGYENLFIFSLIRYFAMEYWTTNVKKMHASMIVILQRFVNNEMSEEMKAEYVENISTYLNRIYPNE